MLKNAKKILSSFLSVVMLLAIVPLGICAADASDPIVVFDMQAALENAAVGSVFAPMGGLQLSGNPAVTVVAGEGGKKSLLVSGRGSDWHGIDIRADALNLVAGKDYVFRFVGSTSADVTLQVGPSNYTGGNIIWAPNTNGPFDRTYTTPSSGLPAAFAGPNVRIQTSGTSDFTISDVIITTTTGDDPEDPPDPDLPPVPVSVIVRLGGADNPWPLHSQITVQVIKDGPDVPFILAPNLTASGITGLSSNLRIQTTGDGWADTAPFFVDDIIVRVGGNIVYDMQTDPMLGAAGTALSMSNTGTARMVINDGATTTIVDNGGKKALHCSNRPAQWNGVSIRYLALQNLVGNNAATVTINGRIESDKTIELPPGAVTWRDVPSLWQTYENYFLIGNISSPGTTIRGESNAIMTEMYKYHYNAVTGENHFKPNSYTTGTYPNLTWSWGDKDSTMAWAKTNGIQVVGHTLAWHAQSANWLPSPRTPVSASVTRAEAKERLELFIQTVAGRFDAMWDDNAPGNAGNMISWDVLNEAHMERTTNWRENLRHANDGDGTSMWHRDYANGANAAAGESGADYVYDAFVFARKYAPHARLYYNDFNDDNQTKTTAIANMTNELNALWATDTVNNSQAKPSYAGSFTNIVSMYLNDGGRLLIEGLGMQAHYSTTTNVGNVRRSLERYIATGAMVSVTELDVGIATAHAGNNEEKIQALVYAELFALYKEHSEHMERVTFWGLRDNISWRAQNKPLIFNGTNDEFLPKEAFFAILDPEAYLEANKDNEDTPVMKTSEAVRGTPSMQSGSIDPVWADTPEINADRIIEGPANSATGVFRVMWDDTHLHVLTIVTDPFLRMDAANDHEKDSVEVFFSPTNNKDGPYVAGADGQYRVNYGNGYTGNPAAAPAGFESVAWVTDTGYIVQMKIPYRGDVIPSLGAVIGFDAQVNDDNGSGTARRTGVAVWCDTTNGSAWSNNSGWGEVTLIGAEPILKSIPAPAAISEVPYGRAKSQAAAPTAAWTLGNYLPRQVEVITNKGPMLANVAWSISTTVIPNDLYNTAVNTPQTFPVNGTVTLPSGVINPDGVHLGVTIIVSVDGGKKADIPWTAVRPTIEDSDIWDNAAVLEIGEVARISTNHPAGEPAATAVANVLWDDENLYIRMKVTDGNMVAGTDHEADGAEVFLSENRTRGNQSAANMNQYRLTSIGATSFRNTTPTTSLISMQAWRRVAQVTDIGYDIFMAIPLLHDNGPVDGKVMLFDIMMNDATMPRNGRTAEISWCDSGHNGYNNSIGWGEITLVRDGPARSSILATAGPNGTVTPSTESGRFWVETGSDQTFAITPSFGFIVDSVTVNGAVAALTDNTYTFYNVTNNNNTIHATFKPDPNAEELTFIVWNDNFATGEYTTAVIIDLGEGNEALGSALSPDMFEVIGRNNRLVGGAVTFSGPRVVTRVYANDVPGVHGYVGPEINSPDYREGLASGRYIVVELEFWTLGGGASTLDDSNSTVQTYRVVANNAITLTDGSIDLMYFTQEKVVNTIIDKFERPTGNSVNRALYLHKNDDGAVQQGLPLYVYYHGMGRGGANAASDQTASLKSANGATALMLRMEKEPEKFASHVMAIAYNGTSAPSNANVKIVIDALVANGSVDPNRIYVAGFSWGGQQTNSIINAYPDFFATAAPMSAVGQYPTAANAAGNAELAYWAFVNLNDGDSYQTNVQGFMNNAMPRMNDVKVSRFDSNQIFVWPYDQWSVEQAPPFGAQSTAPHEVEATVLYNKISEANWNIRPVASTSPWNDDYPDLFEWMFDQSNLNRFAEVRSASLSNTEGVLTALITPKNGRNPVSLNADKLSAVLTVDGKVADALVFSGYDRATGYATWTFEPYRVKSFTWLELEATVTYEDGGLVTSASDSDVSIHIADASPRAVVEQIPGNKNWLNIWVSEKLSDGTEETFHVRLQINNNAEGTYKVGPYSVYVDTKGNTQIRSIQIIIKP